MNGKGLEMSLKHAPTMGEVARGLRVMAAVAPDTAAITLIIQPATARTIAHHLDGGGFLADQAFMLATAEKMAAAAAEDNAVWMAKCQGLLEKARRENAKAMGWLFLSIVFATLGLLAAWVG